MSRKSKHRAHASHTFKNSKGHGRRRRSMDDEQELFREDFTVREPRPAYPKQVMMKVKEPQPNKYDEEKIKELVQLAKDNEGQLAELKFSTKIEKAKQKRQEHYIKAFDIWSVPQLDMPTTDFTGKELPKPHKPSKRVPSVDEIQGKPDQVISLPLTGVSYNPTYLAQQKIIDKSAKQYIADDREAARLKSIRPSSFTPEEIHEDHINALVQFMMSRDKEADAAPLPVQPESDTVISNGNEVSDEGESDDSSEGDSKLAGATALAAAAAKIPVTDETKRLLDENKLEPVHMTQLNRRLKRRQIREMTEELRALEKIVDSVGISTLATSIDAGIFDITKLTDKHIKEEIGEAPKKIRQPSDRPIPHEDVPVPLTEECKGTMRLIKPLGSVFEDRWIAAQRRNLVETSIPNNPAKQNATVPYKVIIH